MKPLVSIIRNRYFKIFGRKDMKSPLKITLIVFGVVVIVTLLIFAIAGSDKGIPVTVEKVKRVNKLVSIVSASGEIKPKEYVDLQSEIAGVIRELYVKEGDRVKKGDILLKIDPVQTEADFEAAKYQLMSAEEDAKNTKKAIDEAILNLEITRAQIKSAKAKLAQALANYNKEKKSFERKKILMKDELISEEDYDLAKASLEVAKSTYEAEKANLEQLETQYKISKINIEKMKNSYRSSLNRVKQLKAMLKRSRDIFEKTILRSPITGVITKLNVEKGERAVPGTLNNPAATLMTIADLSIIQAEVKVDETDIINVKVGQKAKVLVDALPDIKINGVVTEVGNSALNTGSSLTTSSQEAKDFKVVVQLINPPDSLRPGLSATADITTAVKKDVIAIPIQAVVVREVYIGKDGKIIKKKPFGNKGKNLKKKELQGVFVVGKDWKVHFTPVKTGIMGENLIEIKSGLFGGEKIVTGTFKALRRLKDGTLVKESKKIGFKKKKRH